LSRIDVHVEDINGPRGGATDIRCVIEAKPLGKRPIVVQTKGAFAEQAVGIAVHTLKATLLKIHAKDVAAHRGT
jgi:hypothetical protein